VIGTNRSIRSSERQTKDVCENGRRGGDDDDDDDEESVELDKKKVRTKRQETKGRVIGGISAGHRSKVRKSENY
jgi:hypothetical protein